MANAVLMAPVENGALAASVFHSGHIRIPALKCALAEQGIEVRRGD